MEQGCINVKTDLSKQGDEDPRIYLVIVPADDQSGFVAKPVLLPKKIYQHVMSTLLEANKAIEEDPDPDNLSVATAMKIAEILSQPIGDIETTGCTDDEKPKNPFRDLNYIQ